MKGVRWILTGILGAGLILCPQVRAEQTQVDYVEYYPTSTGIPDPFHVNRLTVGNTYAAFNPPADSAAVAGFVGVKTSSPAVPLHVGPRDGVNSGGAIRLLGAGANQNFYLANNAGSLGLFSGVTAAETEKIRFLQASGVGIYKGALGLRDPVGELEIGARDATNSGGELLWAGAVNGGGLNTVHPFFYIENNTGQMRLIALKAGTASTFEEKMRVLSDGSTGIFLSNLHVQNPRAPLEVGPITSPPLGGAGGRVRFLRAGGTDKWFQLQNTSNEFRVTVDGAGATIFRLRSSDGNTALGSGAAPAANVRLYVQGGNANFSSSKVGLRIAAPRALLHINDSDNGTNFTGSLCIVMRSDFSSVHLGYALLASGPALLMGRYYGTPAYLQIESGRVGVHASPLRDDKGNNYPSNMSMVVKAINQKSGSPYQGAVYMDGALFGTDSAGIPSGNMVMMKGSAEATSWSPPPSSIHLKTDVVPLTSVEEQRILEELLQTPLYHYRLKEGDYAKANRIGFLIEEAPPEILDDSGTWPVRGDSLAAILAAVKSQQCEIDALRVEVQELKK